MTEITVSEGADGALLSSDNRADANNGSSPATQTSPAGTKAQNGFAISLRTQGHHTHRRHHTRTAASRREAAVTSTAESENSKWLRSSSLERVPEVLGTTRRLPGHRRSSEVVGVDLTTKELTGAEDEDGERAT